MKKALLFFLASGLMLSCNPKKTDSTGVTDSLRVDSAVLATEPAPAQLAFGEISGFSLNNKLIFTDSVNYFLFNSQEELNQNFDKGKSSSGEVVNPDFTINYVIGVAYLPTQYLTTIAIDKVEIFDRDINVFLNIRRGEKQTAVSKPAQVFAIERRDGYLGLQFFVNGKKDKAFMLQ